MITRWQFFCFIHKLRHRQAENAPQSSHAAEGEAHLPPQAAPALSPLPARPRLRLGQLPGPCPSHEGPSATLWARPRSGHLGAASVSLSAPGAENRRLQVAFPPDALLCSLTPPSALERPLPFSLPDPVMSAPLRSLCLSCGLVCPGTIALSSDLPLGTRFAVKSSAVLCLIWFNLSQAPACASHCEVLGETQEQP